MSMWRGVSLEQQLDSALDLQQMRSDNAGFARYLDMEWYFFSPARTKQTYCEVGEFGMRV